MTLRRVVLLGPLLGLAVVITGVLFGIKLAERQFDYIEDRVQRSLAYQYTAMTQSILFERTHSYMIQLSQLFQNDDTNRSIALQLQLLQQSQRRLSGLSGALDPRVEKYDLEQRLTWLKGVIADAENASRDEPLPHHQAEFREISTLFNKIAGQTRVLVQQDLNALKDETVALIWQLFRMLLGLGVVLCAVSYAVAQLISRPILSLAHTVAALDQGNLE
ncbi:hypothetical protein [Yoonia sediminilitoris]|nr:hypothetical protein [Yoonia sediminilitoris]